MAHAMILDTGKPDDNSRDPNASPVRLSKPFVVMARGESVGCLLSTCLQHEIDHLDGALFIDYLSRLKRDMLLKKLNKARRAA